MDYNEQGYVAGSPLPVTAWKQVCPDEPAGLVVVRGGAPPGILVVHNFVPEQVCRSIVAECDAGSGLKSAVLTPTTNDKMAVEETAGRVCETIVVDQLKTDVTQLVRRAFIDVIGPHFRRQIEGFEKPDILRYRTGGEYQTHADSDSWIPAERLWRKTVDRDFSLLMYINQEFEGGELSFPTFGMTLAPRAGMLLAFPSDHRYLHVARPVKSGVRYAIVSWAQAKGLPRVQAAPRPNLIRL